LGNVLQAQYPNWAGLALKYSILTQPVKDSLDRQTPDQNGFAAGLVATDDVHLRGAGSQQIGQELEAFLVGCAFHGGRGQANFQSLLVHTDDLVSAGTGLDQYVEQHSIGARV
jgi:hypothetical protein